MRGTTRASRRRAARARPAIAAAVVLALSGIAGCAPADTTVVLAERRAAAAAAQAEPADLRVQLEALLGQHVFLVVRLTRAQLRDDPALFETLVDALTENTDDLAAVVESVYDADAGAAFRRLWSAHTRSFFVYAKALSDDDAAAQRRARRELDAYRGDFGEFVATATDGALAADAVAGELAVHVDHLLDQADAYAAGDYGAAYDLEREAYAHMFPTGETLAGGFAASTPGELPVAVDVESQQLRSTLGMALGEHVELAIDALRAGVADAPDFPAAAAALDANSADLAAAVEGLYGADASEQFAGVWADHIDLFSDYAVAVAEDDDAARDDVRDGLMTYHEALGDFFEGATDGRVTAADVGALLGDHDRQVLEAVEAYAQADYATASDLSYEGYQTMFDTAAALAAAIGGEARASQPEGGVHTGGGGVAHQR